MARELSGVFVMLTGIAMILFFTSQTGQQIYGDLKKDLKGGKA